MKILANRLGEDIDKIRTDLDDAVALMKVTGLSTQEELLALLKECYPQLPGIVEPVVAPRIKVRSTLL